MFSVMLVIVACNSSTAPACSVAPSARLCDASARFVDPADTWLDASSIERNVTIIWFFISRIARSSFSNSPWYTSGQSVLISKLPLAISARCLPQSAITSFNVSFISFAVLIISATSSWVSTTGNGSVRLPFANVVNLSLNSPSGTAIPFAMELPILIACIMANTIIATITIRKIILMAESFASREFPSFTFASSKPAVRL